jgi:hypothetical protein
MNTENQTPKEGAISFEDIAGDFTFDLPTEEVKEEKVETTELTFENEEGVKPTETEEEVEDTPKEEDKPKAKEKAPSENPFFQITKKLIESGKWGDAVIEDEEGNEVKLSEYTNLTEEEYINLIEKQQELEKEELKEKYLSTEGADETKKKIASIILNGGDLKELFESPEAMVKPFSEELGWDLDNEQHQASIVYQHFLSQGMTEKQAKSLVKAAQEELNLDTQAQQIVDFHQKNYDAKLQKIEQDLIAEKEAEKERVKSYKSDLAKIYKEQKLPDTLTKRLVDLATKENEEGELLIDELYNKVMQDPKEAQEVILFLADREKYLQSKMLETKRTTQVDTFKKISLLPKDKAKKATSEEPTAEEFTFELPTQV